VSGVLGAIAAIFAARGGLFTPPPARRGEEIVVGGERIPIGTPVVLWSDPGGYDAYLKTCFFDRTRVLPTHPAPGADTPERIGKRRAQGPLAEVVTQLVLHYDMAWTSRNCFKVLQDRRGLSVHFLCDMDGTLYQTCDVAERCRHAREANDRSVGVEIAHPGALEEVKGLAARYKADEAGVRLELPAAFGAEPFRTAGFVPRPARGAPIAGTIHGKPRTMWDYTDAQYRALARLAAGLSRALPRIRLEAPRDERGRVLDRAFVISPSSVAFEGIVGHHHLQADKFDPGPAFDWERFLEEARRARDGMAP
jgi:N-acetyl-anhydromuramyl-L-alanine amidase AmpD